MDRRTLLKTGGMGLLGLGLGGCAGRQGAGALARPPLGLTPVDVSWDRIIRTTVGLRPHRPSGFVVRAERLDDKTVIHNYGHGGAGISLTWGTGYLAADLAMQHTERRAAVVGCGAAGLTTARQLQRRGFEVTIYSMSVPPNTTSNMSLAGWTPTSGLLAAGRRTPEWTAQFQQAASIAYTQLQLLVGSKYGVSWIDFYSMMDELPVSAQAGGGQARSALLPAELQTGEVFLGPGEHPFPVRYVGKSSALRIEPSIYLDALVSDFLLSGGRLLIRKFDSTRDLAALDESLIVNCTGLGARELFDDEELMPLKGQLTLLVPQLEIDYGTLGGLRQTGGFPIHMQPRRDGIALGGTSERGVSSLEPNEEARRRIVEQHLELFSAMPAPR